jgi:hypothetical protein
MSAQALIGYKELKLVDLPKPAVTDGKVLVRIIVAGLRHWTEAGFLHLTGRPAPAIERKRSDAFPRLSADHEMTMP